MWIQSKCGIRREDGIKFFDFSKEHITEAIDGILTRLNVDHIDSLLLHRPDALMQTEEINEAIEEAVNAGKIIVESRRRIESRPYRLHQCHRG